MKEILWRQMQDVFFFIPLCFRLYEFHDFFDSPRVFSLSPLRSFLGALAFLSFTFCNVWTLVCKILTLLSSLRLFETSLSSCFSTRSLRFDSCLHTSLEETCKLHTEFGPSFHSFNFCSLCIPPPIVLKHFTIRHNLEQNVILIGSEILRGIA